MVHFPPMRRWTNWDEKPENITIQVLFPRTYRKAFFAERSEQKTQLKGAGYLNGIVWVENWAAKALS